MTFQKKLETIVKKNNSLLCVGLDPVMEKLPQHLIKKKYPFFEFNKAIINATANLVCCFKPNSAFYEALGEKGIGELKKTCNYIKKKYPEIPIILDAKRGDIGSTNEGYVRYAFDYLQTDAITLHPYLGSEAIQPFLKRKDKGCIILCRTSNPGAGEMQDVRVILGSQASSLRTNVKQSPLKSQPHPNPLLRGEGREKDKDFSPLYRLVAEKVVKEWNVYGNCMLVVGATYPEELAEIRKLAGDMTFLIPGIGAQGGDIEATVKAGMNSKKAGMIISSSREITFADSGKDFAKKSREKAQQVRDTINKYR